MHAPDRWGGPLICAGRRRTLCGTHLLTSQLVRGAACGEGKVTVFSMLSFLRTCVPVNSAQLGQLVPQLSDAPVN